MTHYLIEFRFFGKSKYEMKQLIYNLNRRFRIGHKRAVPHISLAGALTTNDQARLINDFKTICSQYPLMGFEIDGFNVFKDNRVVFIDIKPSKHLDEFRWELSKRLQPYCRLKDFDYKQDFKYHATLAMKLDHNRFNQIKSYVERLKQPKYKHFMLRVTLIRDSKILYEYDFLQRRLLSRWEAKNPIQYKKTMTLLKDFFEGRYNPNKNIRMKITNEEKKEEPKESEEISSKELQCLQCEIIIPRKTLIQKMMDYIKPSKIFLISDLHLDHANIIKYCKRPFKNVNRMNTVLVNNWNRTIRDKDTVYFLGDLSFGTDSRRTDYWLKQLHGKIIFIRGNHDKSDQINLLDSTILKYKGKEFYLVHDPKDIPQDWKGWVICGHHHNNYLKEFPFVDGKNKHINVGVELIGYQPLNINKLFELDFENIEFMETINSEAILKK